MSYITSNSIQYMGLSILYPKVADLTLDIYYH